MSYTLEGCRNNGTILLPNGDGNFICPDAAYTTGNLGKGWNELDLVPHRATLTAGNSAPATQTFLFQIAADNCNADVGSPYTCADGTTIGAPGYDDMSVPVLNADLSDASCAAPDSVSAMQVLSPGVGGTDVSIYRDVTVTQAKNTVCVYDYYERLALGSHLYNGSSLHSNLINPSGRKDVPLPVKDVLPQSLRKEMSAVANASVTWNLTKEPSDANVSFGDVCAPDAPTDIPVSVTITWTKNAATPGDVTVTTLVYATNPAARTITVNVTDNIYKGLTQADLLDSESSGDVDIPANKTVLVMTHTVPLDPSAGGVGDFLNDVATGTYHDAVTDVPIPGTTTATANTQITAGSVSDDTADISDSESITDSQTALTFSVPSPSVGSFLNGYVAGTPTTGPVDWNALAQSSGGTITFAKTIYLANQSVTSGTLSDTALLDTTSQHLSSPVSIGVTSSATVTLTVSKSIPADYLNLPGDTLKVYFHVEGTLVSGYSNDISFTFENGGLTTLSTDLNNLTPDTYTVTEDVASGEYCDAADNCTNATLLVPFENPIVVDLLPQSGSMLGRCSGTAAFNNIAQEGAVRVEVQKITDPVLASDDPDYLWDFTLSGPTTCEPAIAGAGAGYVLFEDSLGGDCLLSDGDYTITETLKTGWQEDGATPNDGIDTLVCAFSVNVILDAGTTKSCTFHNTRYGHVNVIKTVAGQAPSGADSFEFQLREGASLSSVGTTLEDLFADAGNGGLLTFATDLVPGNHYQLCEIVLPGWSTSLSPTFVPNGNDPGADNSVQCVDFTVNAGETKTFEVDNTPPPGGEARTIGFWRNWASCRQSRGHQEPVLDETLQAVTPPGIQVGSFYIVYPECSYAVNLLSKKQMTTGIKMPGDPLFNMTAQLVAAELNIAAGAGTCAAANSAISQANLLLIKYSFTGDGYTGKLSKADANLANNLGGQLDMYNNNTLCP